MHSMVFEITDTNFPAKRTFAYLLAGFDKTVGDFKAQLTRLQNEILKNVALNTEIYVLRIDAVVLQIDAAVKRIGAVPLAKNLHMR